MTSEQKMTRLLLQASEDLQKIHDQLIKELSKVAAQNIDAVTPNEFYSIAEACTPTQKARVRALLDEYRDMVVSLAERGITRAVSLSASNSQLILAQYTKFTGEETEKWREKTAKAFIQSRMKRDKGLSLSDRVWNYTQQTKAEFELAVSQVLEDGISKGTSAERLGRRVREHLNNPDMMYRRYHRKKVLADGTKKDIVEWRRRVVDADGKVHFIKEDLAAVETGVYRSARQNALRLTITETNMAYNYANCKRWTEEPFVLGIRIRLSGNHPAPDICDTLQGEYPRDFMWRGWHPRCRCSQSPILMDRDSDEWKKLRAMDADEYKKYKSPNRITAAPAAFQEWCKKNKEKLTKARERGKLPYFVRDNEKAVGKLLGWKNAEPTKGAALTKQEEIKARAAQRHANRTPEEIADIQRRAKEREDRHALMRKTAANVLKAAADYPEVSLDALRKAIKADNLDAMYSLAKQTARQLAPIKKDERALSVLIPDVHEWRKQFSSAELHKVYKSVESSLKEWSVLPLEEQAENLKYMWSELLGGNKYGVQSRYKEWKVAQAAFKRKYTQVVDAIDWRKIDGTLEAAKAFQTKSQQYRALVGKLEAAVTAKDKAEAQKVIADILKKRAELEKAAAQSGGASADALSYSQQQRDNFKEIEEALHTQRGVSMDFESANQGKGNIGYKTGAECYKVNCQSSVVAHELRMRGFDVTAQPNWKMGDDPQRLSHGTWKCWKNADGTQLEMPKPFGYKISRTGSVIGVSLRELLQGINERTQEVGRYHVSFQWKGRDYGHIVTMERKADGTVLWYDPQTGERNFFDKEYAKKIKWVSVYRVDNLLFDAKNWNVVRPSESPETSAPGVRRGMQSGNARNARTGVAGATRVNLTREIIDYRKKVSSELSRTGQGAKLKDGELKYTASSLKRSIVHAKDKAEADMFLYVASHFEKMIFKRKSPLGENKDTESTIDRNNIAKKKKRGVLFYNVYEIEKDGQIWTVKTEVCENGTEIPYTIYKNRAK